MTARDTFDLARFLAAQEEVFPQALQEIQAGRKLSHWMWFIFPQLRGLGRSERAKFFGITGIEESQAYLAHPVLGTRLVQICEALLALDGLTAREILGEPDDMKLRSCATLFSFIAEPGSVFHQILEKYFSGVADGATLAILKTGVAHGQN